jgi:hypothetical protein
MQRPIIVAILQCSTVGEINPDAKENESQE